MVWCYEKKKKAWLSQKLVQWKSNNYLKLEILKPIVDNPTKGDDRDTIHKMPLEYSLRHDCEVFSSCPHPCQYLVLTFFWHKSSRYTVILIEVFFVISLVINEIVRIFHMLIVFLYFYFGGNSTTHDFYPFFKKKLSIFLYWF